MLYEVITVHGAELADIQFGDKVAVIGIGPVGLMAVAASAIRGASEIFAVGSRPNCVELAKEFGATDVINYHDGDIAEQIIRITSYNVCYTKLLRPLYNGHTVIAYEGSNDASTWINLIKKHECTIFIGVPTIYRQIIQKTDFTIENCPSLRYCMSAGA